ncbi:MAG: Homoserine O-acetyltransferase [Acidimicrobiales bacterium]|nr:Homoserine O-acetyltransferase [Acidimicrobiales bacterium]
MAPRRSHRSPASRALFAHRDAEESSPHSPRDFGMTSGSVAPEHRSAAGNRPGEGLDSSVAAEPAEEPLPVTGAWQPGDPVGRRQFLPTATERPFHLEGGGSLRDVTVAYETWGELDAAASNAVLVCHALTGDSHAAGRLGEGHPTPGWWGDLIGPGLAVDTDRYFVVCANVLGGCQGSTGPASVDPGTGRPYGSRFPVVSIRDMVRAQGLLANHLGVRRWLTVLGGSMGGMQVLEWAVMYPHRVRSIIPIATCTAASAQQIAWSYMGRRAVHTDPNFCDGDYYDNPPGQGPHRGLAVARGIAQITYRSEGVFAERFGRNLLDPLDEFTLWQRFDVEGYLDYHGDKLVRRFDANTYLVLNKSMDLHDLGRGRGGVAKALRRIVVPTYVMSINSDALYPNYQQRELYAELLSSGTPTRYFEIDSPHGHDAFLLETQQVTPPIAEFLDDVHSSRI